jgi:hypothetical protein
METTFVKHFLEEHPNDRTSAFYLNNDKNTIYFQLEEPTKIDSSLPNGLACVMPTLKLVLEGGNLLPTKLYLKKQDVREFITNARFLVELKEGLRLTKLRHIDDIVGRQILKFYKECGF